MFKLFEIKKFNLDKNIKNIFLTKQNIKKLDKLNHTIGLHSHSHPTRLSELNYNQQFKEYYKNKKILEKIIGTNKIFSMSHPCGSYNENTLNILKKLNIKLGFNSHMSEGNKINAENYNLKIAREDYSNVKRKFNLI